MRPSRVYAAAALAALGLIGTAWVMRDSFRPVGPGEEAPDFSYPNLAGQAVTLSELRGKVVLVNLWATWCPPCKEEMPSMQRLYDALEGKPFEILAISVDADVGQFDWAGRPGGDIQAFMDEMGLSFPVLRNPAGDIQSLYQTTGLPESFLVGPDGVIRRKVAGPTIWDTGAFQEQIERMLSP